MSVSIGLDASLWRSCVRYRRYSSAQIERVVSRWYPDALRNRRRRVRVGFVGKIEKLEVKGPEKELVEYWQRNLRSFPEAEQIDGLRRLAAEVQQDLSIGPVRAIEDLNLGGV